MLCSLFIVISVRIEHPPQSASADTQSGSSFSLIAVCLIQNDPHDILVYIIQRLCEIDDGVARLA